jgi:hypothetical protein
MYNVNDQIVYNNSYNFAYQNNTQFYNFVLGPVTFISFNPNAIIYNLANSAQVMQ